MKVIDLFKQMAVLLATALILAFGLNAISPRGIPWLGQWDETRGVVTADQTDLQLTLDFEIPDAAAALALHATGKVVFVDSRSAADYRAGHIPGAVSLPLGEFERHIALFQQRYASAQPVVTYCSGRSCQDSHILAQRFFEVGYENVSVFIDGYPGWTAEGYPIETP
jgi:rhodanese-related sulfurtransferase